MIVHHMMNSWMLRNQSLSEDMFDAASPHQFNILPPPLGTCRR
jgi:hypothetical protein